DLPPEPRNWAEAMKHPFSQQWLEAAQAELNANWDKGVFTKVPEDSISGTEQVLLLKWVFHYKFDADGTLQKFKARICIRGDLQEPNDLDTYASTLAARSFRTMMAIIARCDLETHQFDVSNAYLNSLLPEAERVYVRYPPGFKVKGYLLRVNRAL